MITRVLIQAQSVTDAFVQNAAEVECQHSYIPLLCTANVGTF